MNFLAGFLGLRRATASTILSLCLEFLEVLRAALRDFPPAFPPKTDGRGILLFRQNLRVQLPRYYASPRELSLVRQRYFARRFGTCIAENWFDSSGEAMPGFGSGFAGPLDISRDGHGLSLARLLCRKTRRNHHASWRFTNGNTENKSGPSQRVGNRLGVRKTLAGARG